MFKSAFYNHTPRWLIFLIDISVCAVSVVLAFLLRFNFSIPEIEIQFIPAAFITIIAVRIISFYLLRTFAGIIRYTSIDDAQRVVYSIFIGTATIALFNVLRYYFYDSHFIVPFSILIIDFLVTTFALVFFRIGVKTLYFEMKKPAKETVNVIIYGAGEAGMATKATIDKDARLGLKVVAFIDDNKRKLNNKLEGIKIYNSESLETIIAKYNPTHIIISTKSIKSSQKQYIIETCLKNQIRVLNVPPINKWINGELSFKQIKQVNIEDLLGRDTIQLDDKKIATQVNNKTILITGAAGSIGSEIVRQLFNYAPKKLILVDIAESPLYELDNELKLINTKVEYEIVIGNVRNIDRLKNIFQTFQPQLVFHAAAYKHVPLMEENPSEGAYTNVVGSKNVADMAVRFNCENFVLVSTDKAVNPTNVMGATKRLAELYVQSLNGKSNTKIIVTRFGNVLGSNGSVIPLFKKQIEKGGPLTVTDPLITRFFMTIPEACQLVLQAGTLGEGGEVFVFDMGESVKIVDLAKKMITLSGLELGKDIQIVFTGLRPGEKLYEELLANNENTLPTPHKKIMIAKVNTIKNDELLPIIASIEQNIESQNNMEIVKLIKSVIPEYKSENSIYQDLD